MPFDPESGHIVGMLFLQNNIARISSYNPGVHVASAAVRCLTENGHLISTNPNGVSAFDGSYMAPSGEAPKHG